MIKIKSKETSIVSHLAKKILAIATYHPRQHWLPFVSVHANAIPAG